MAKTLRMTFSADSGDTRNISVNVPRADLNSENVGAAMAKIVTNGTAFEDNLTGALKAVLTETNTTVLVDNTD